MQTVFRPTFGRVMTWIFAALGVIASAVVLFDDGTRAALRFTPWAALVVGTVWAIYWRPEVAVDDGGVRVVNVLRTIVVPWPAIERIDTKWALTLFTSYGKVTAWAAPAPGGFATRMAGTQDLKGLPESTYGPQGSVRPGDLPGSASGAAALVVRRQWEQLRDAGHLDNPRLEFDAPPTSWHYRTILVAAVLVLFGLLGVALL
jgi:hypothetical protein